MNAMQRVYAYVVLSEGSVRAKTCAEATGVHFKTVQNALRRLRIEGLVKKTVGSFGPHCRWIVARKPIELGERRGKAKGSQIALRTYGGSCEPKRGVEKLKNLKGVKLENGVFHPKPKPKTALEIAWGWGA